jgi:hypothetical protein
MFAQVLAGFSEAAEVDDLSDVGGLGRPRKAASKMQITIAILRPRNQHRVDQVVGGVAAVHGVAYGRLIRRVALDHFELRVGSPRTPIKLAC